MKKYRVYGIVSATVDLGEYEAESKEAAQKMAENNDNVDWNPSICHQCANELEVGDVYEVMVEECE